MQSHDLGLAQGSGWGPCAARCDCDCWDDWRPAAYVADYANDHTLMWPLAPTATNARSGADAEARMSPLGIFWALLSEVSCMLAAHTASSE